MGITAIAVTVLRAARSNQGKIIYRCAKGICVGQPAIRRCMKELVECWAEIDANKVAGDACKRAFLCLTPMTGIATVTLLAEAIDHPAAKTIAKTSYNLVGLTFSGPAYGVDKILAPIETLVFGEPVPIISGGRLFLFGNPLDD